MSAKSTWIVAGIAVAVLALVIVIVAEVWVGFDAGDGGMSAGGMIAMGLGIVVTLALGIGLMTLVFISSRRGYDEAGQDRR